MQVNKEVHAQSYRGCGWENMTTGDMVVNCGVHGGGDLLS